MECEHKYCKRVLLYNIEQQQEVAAAIVAAEIAVAAAAKYWVYVMG